MAELDLVSKLTEEDKIRRRIELDGVSPDDAKYGVKTRELRKKYLSANAEWGAFTFFQYLLLETRAEFGQAEQKHVNEVNAVLEKIDPLNITLLEDQVTHHDQLAVIEEIGRFVSPEIKALLHPGTTSFDVVDSIRSYLFKRVWTQEIRPVVLKDVKDLSSLAERYLDMHENDLLAGKEMKFLQVGRTHLQYTTPVPFGVTLSSYAARIAERVRLCDNYFDSLKGKVSGIVGTGAGIEMIIGEGKSIEFEKAVLRKLDLEPDYTATQIVQKETLADVGHGLTTLMYVLADFADDIRKLYGSDIREVFSQDNSKRLGASSTDALKDNPIDWENIIGTAPVVESGMRILYNMIPSDFQRDLTGSKMARYQPQQMMIEVYESFQRFGKALSQLTVNEERMAENLRSVRRNPSEAMVTILRGEKWIHSKYGVGHDFVKEMGKIALRGKIPLLEVCMDDVEFKRVYVNLSQEKQDILQGKLEKYIGSSIERARENLIFGATYK